MNRRGALLTGCLCALVASLALAGSASAATFNVTNTNNSGPGSLRDAINQANAAADADTITIPAGTFPITGNGDDTNVTGDLDITHDVTINGAGAGNTTVDGGHNDRIFDIFNAPTSVTVNGVALVNGNNQTGGTIRHAGAALSFSDVRLAGSTAGGGGVPGAGTIYWSPTMDATLNITNSTITDNHVGGGGGGGSGTGGVLFLSSSTKQTISLTDTTVTGNTAGGGGAAAAAGALYITPGGAGGSLTLKNTTISGNSAGGGGVGGSGTGGAVYFSSSGGHTISLDGSSISNNRAGGDGAPAAAGGIYDSPGGGGGSLTLKNTTISGNSAGGGGPGGSGTGGGLYFSSSGTQTISASGSSINNNRAGGGGAAGTAGGLYNSPGGGGGTLTLTDTTVDNNSAGGGGSGTGGGLYFSSSGSLTLTATNASVSNNTAGGGGGAAAGGGIYDSPGAPGGEFRLTNTKVDGNTAGGGGPGGSGSGGGVFYSSGGDQPAKLDRTSISNNAVGGGGAVSGAGGGIYYSPGSAASSFAVVNATVSGNASTGTASGIGGGLFVGDGTTAITNATIANNTASVAASTGGGIFLGAGTTSLKNSIVAGNSGTTGANCFGAVTSAGHNLESADTCSFNAAGDQKNTDPKLGPFADNGGPTKTLNLLKGSPAIDGGDNSGCPTTDQRGGLRPQPPAGTCDIGAYEYGGLADLTMSSKPSPDPASAGKNLTYTLTATNSGPSPDDATGVKVTDTLPAKVSLISAKTSQGSCSGKGQVSCTIGTLAKGASAKITVVVKPPHEGTAVNVPTVSGDPTDPNPANGTAQTSTTVRVGISGFRLRPRTFNAAGAGASIARRAGARVAYKLSDKATVTFKVQKPRTGRKSKSGSCGAKSKKNKGGKRCTYYKSVKGSFKRKSKSGKNSFRFTGRLRRHKLPAGRYQLVATAKGKTGNSAAARTSFKIKL